MPFCRPLFLKAKTTTSPPLFVFLFLLCDCNSYCSIPPSVVCKVQLHQVIGVLLNILAGAKHKAFCAVSSSKHKHKKGSEEQRRSNISKQLLLCFTHRQTQEGFFSESFTESFSRLLLRRGNSEDKTEVWTCLSEYALIFQDWMCCTCYLRPPNTWNERLGRVQKTLQSLAL